MYVQTVQRHASIRFSYHLATTRVTLEKYFVCASRLHALCLVGSTEARKRLSDPVAARLLVLIGHCHTKANRSKLRLRDCLTILATRGSQADPGTRKLSFLGRWGPITGQEAAGRDEATFTHPPRKKVRAPLAEHRDHRFMNSALSPEAANGLLPGSNPFFFLVAWPKVRTQGSSPQFIA